LTGSDQFPITYPDVSRLGICHAGCEVRDEINTIIDDTFSIKVIPCHCKVRNHATKLVPVRIPADVGKVITVTLSARKTQSQAAGDRPQIHLRGPGFEDNAEMSDVMDTWDELEVSGTMGTTGVAEFWVSVKNDYDPRSADIPDNWYSPKDYEWQEVFFDGFSVSITES
jgi:hypothetical protein